MAIFSLHHAVIGKATQRRPHTAAAHIRYISRKSACSRLIGERMPVKSGQAQGWIRQQEADDRKNARVCDKVLLALPRELNAEQRAALVRSFAEKVTSGRASWLAAFHDRGEDRHNPHCHLVIRDRDPETRRRVSNMSERGSTEMLRLLWERHANAALKDAGRDERIDRRSLASQGIKRRPTIHEGLSSREMIAKGKRIRSRPVNVRNSAGARTSERVVDYRRFDRGRSRPGYNRYVQETEADYWAAIDTDARQREFEALRAIHKPGSVNVSPIPGLRSHETQRVLKKRLIPDLLAKPVGLPPRSTARLDIRQTAFEPITNRIARGKEQDKFADTLGPPPLAPGGGMDRVSGVAHTESVNRPSEFVKGRPMIDDEELRNRKNRERDNARYTADRDQAHYDNLMERSFLDPASADQKMDAFRAKHGNEKLHEKLAGNSRKTAFGRRPGSILSPDGYSEGAALKRQDSQIARQLLPEAVKQRNASKERLATADRVASGNDVQSFKETLGSMNPKNNSEREKEKASLLERWRRAREKDKELGR